MALYENQGIQVFHFVNVQVSLNGAFPENTLYKHKQYTMY